MSTFLLPFGKQYQTITFPDTIHVDQIDPADVAPRGDQDQIIQAALDQVTLNYSEETRVGIGINDKTRPVPHERLLPPLLHKLEAAGVKPENIIFFIATGTHQPMPAYEFGRVLPDDILARYRIVSHDANDVENLIYLGETSYNTPVYANYAFHQMDVKIVVGNVEPHHFAGFSGGMKTAAIGLTGWDTINRNHARLVEPTSRFGIYEQNSLRQDIEEIGKMMGIDYALNAVLSAHKEVIYAFFGEPGMVMAEAIPASRSVCMTPFTGLYDVVIASAGGHPKDINFYQAQKAMTYAAEITRDGGSIILVAACPEGSGSRSYEAFMEGMSSYEDVLQRFQREGFRVGPHKGLQVSLIGSRKRLILVSLMAPEDVYRFLITPAPDVQSAFELVKSSLPENVRVAILPHATNTIPVLAEGLE